LPGATPGKVTQVRRAVLVTGGSRGIGAAIALAFAERGDRVAVHYRDAVDAAGAVRDSLPGPGHLVVQADLADAAAVAAMVEDAAGRLGGLDVLVNNAGVYVEHPVTGTSYEEWQGAWQATLGVNLIGAANVTWCAVRHMITGARGGKVGMMFWQQSMGEDADLIVTPAPIHETSFQDRGQPGVRYTYAVQAVDKAGNLSAPSDRVEETAR